MDTIRIATIAWESLTEALGAEHFVDLSRLEPRFIQLLKMKLQAEAGKAIERGGGSGYEVIFHRNTNSGSTILIQSIEWRLAPGEEIHRRRFLTSRAGVYLGFLAKEGNVGTWKSSLEIAREHGLDEVKADHLVSGELQSLVSALPWFERQGALKIGVHWRVTAAKVEFK